MSLAGIPIIVTRAEPGATETVERLNARGLIAILSPMLSLVELPDRQIPDSSDLSGLVFTSANGVRTYARRRTDRHLPAWCVGPATSQAARDEGFEVVHESAGNAVDLAHFIAARSPPLDHPLLHVANMAATGVLRETLSAKGFQTVFAPIYKMQPAQTLPKSVARLIDQNDACIVLVHSEKGASAFATQIGTRALTNCIGVAISERASQPLERLNPDAIYTAAAPNEDGLFAALEIALATLSA